MYINSVNAQTPIQLSLRLSSLSMAELLQLLDLLRSNADALNTITLANLFHFVTYAAHLKDDILLPQPVVYSPLAAPELLPRSVLHFLSSACGFSLETTEHCWSILKDIVWHSNDFAPEGTNFEACAWVFLAHGHTFGLCTNSLHCIGPIQLTMVVHSTTLNLPA